MPLIQLINFGWLSKSIIESFDSQITTLGNKDLDEGIEMGGEEFSSLLSTHAWATLNALVGGSFVHFVDAHGLLTLGRGVEVISIMEVLQLEVASYRAGNRSVMEALILSSFKLEPPAFFGCNSKNSQAINDSRELPAIKFLNLWCLKKGYVGTRFTFKKAVKEVDKN